MMPEVKRKRVSAEPLIQFLWDASTPTAPGEQYACTALKMDGTIDSASRSLSRLRLLAWYLVFLLALLAPTCAAFAQSQSGAIASSSDEVRAVVERTADKYFKDAPHAAALSIGVFKDGNSYIYNFGSVQRDKHDPPSANTLYLIASITKTFTGTLLAQAVLEGKVQFTDDVRKYLDGAYPNLEYEGHPIQLQFLINHVSGLPFNLPDIPGNRPPFTPPMSTQTRERVNRYTRADFLRDLHDVKLTSVPGQKFSYSNAGAELLSLVLERVYGESYEKLVQQKIAAPLGMKDTTISLTRSQRRRLAPGYDENGKINFGEPIMALGAGALKSSISDLLKYAAWETAEDDAAVKLSHEPRLNLMPDYSFGLNWQILRRGKDVRIWEDGSVPGFLSFCVVFPKLHMAIVVLSNELDRPVTSNAFDAIAPSIAESIDPRSNSLFSSTVLPQTNGEGHKDRPRALRSLQKLTLVSSAIIMLMRNIWGRTMTAEVEWKKVSAELLILSLVEARPRHGYEISKLIEQRSGGAVRFYVASLYPLLYRLEKRGWIQGRWVEKSGQRRRRYYRLTAEGQKVLTSQRRGWRAFVEAVNRITEAEHA